MASAAVRLYCVAATLRCGCDLATPLGYRFSVQDPEAVVAGYEEYVRGYYPCFALIRPPTLIEVPREKILEAARRLGGGR